MIAFTICARNFLGQAQVLHDGLRRHHPDLSFYVALADEVGSLERDAFPFPILTLESIAVPGVEGMIERYNVTEFNTALKPFVFLELFDQFPDEPVVYFDPDIAVFSPLDELEEALAGGADCVLTPHLCEPAEYAEMHEGRILQFGVHNLGFCALRGAKDVRRVASWWGRRLEHQCVIDLPAGLFVDQKWADLLPSFIERTVILRHPGYNVGYWNLSQRTVRQVGDEWHVNGRPLRFFHFSGSVVDEPVVFSRHSSEFRLGTLRDVGDLFKGYVEDVRRHGRPHYRTIPYAFHWDGASGPNLHTPEESARTAAGGWLKGGLRSGDELPHLPVTRARSLEEYRKILAGMTRAVQRRRALEASLIPSHGNRFAIDGYCIVCGGPATLNCSFMYSARTLSDGRQIPNWREHLNCDACGFTNRLRACLHLLEQEVGPGAEEEIYVTEQVTPLFSWLRDRYGNLVGSEYLGADCEPGETVDGLRHEDVQRLSFPDASFDLVLSFEVLEHVPFADAALAELARCIKPGGALFLTAPFRDDREGNEERAVLQEDGSIEHLLPPEMHGNPVDPDAGALCYRYYGWQVMDDLRSAGFSRAEAWFYWSRRFGYLGDTNSIIVAWR